MMSYFSYIRIIILTVIVCAIYSTSTAQLKQCRPRLCMFDYNYHNDNVPNADMSTIKSIRPDMLVDNTPHGFWGELNGYVGCNPLEYRPLGIQVFSYIAGGYEGTLYNNDTDNLYRNITRIVGIKSDSANGVFLDEVSSYPDSTDKIYIDSIYRKCRALGLKLILNPGVNSFDPWLMSHCDYLLSDEQYDGKRAPTVSELPFLDRIIVITENITDDTSAANVSLGARSYCFGYSYACTNYTSLPSWLGSYDSLITEKPRTPTTSISNDTLFSNANCGTQWYDSSGAILGANKSVYKIKKTGVYYSITMIDGCSSDTSNKLTYTAPVTDIVDVEVAEKYFIYPNPATTYLTISKASNNPNVNLDVKIFNPIGSLVLSYNNIKPNTTFDIGTLTPGAYLLVIKDVKGLFRYNLVII